MNKEASANHPSGVIKNVGLLDLTAMKSADDLQDITRIERVGVVLAPESLASAVMRIPMDKVGQVASIPEGKHVKLQTGQIKLSGEALANSGGNDDDVLVLVGQIRITSPVQSVGYAQLIVYGQLYAPKGSEGALGAGITRQFGQMFYYDERSRFFVGAETLSKEFFGLLSDPIEMFITGMVSIDPDVTVDLLRAKVSNIVLAGVIGAPKHLVPVLQILTTEKSGEIQVQDIEDD